MKRFRKATAIYTLPTRSSRKAGSISSSTDASSSNEAVHLQQRLKSLSTELVTLRNRLHVGQTGTGTANNTNNNNNNNNNGNTTTAATNVGNSNTNNCMNSTTSINGLTLNLNNTNNGINGTTQSAASTTNPLLQTNCNTGTTTTATSIQQQQQQSITTGQSTTSNVISGTTKNSQTNLNVINQISNSNINNKGNSGCNIIGNGGFIGGGGGDSITNNTLSNTINSDNGGNKTGTVSNIRNSNISTNKTYPLSIPPGGGGGSGTGNTNIGNSAIISSRNTSIPLPLPHHVIGSIENRCDTISRRSIGILNDLHTTITTSGTTAATAATHTKSYDAIISHTTKPLTFDYANGNSNGQCNINGINSNGINNNNNNNINNISNCGVVNNINIITAATKTIDNGKQKKPNEMDDLIHLTGPLTEDAVTRTLQSRFNNNEYFTNVGPILLSINPYHDVGNPLTLSSTRSLPLANQLRRIVQEAVRQQAETGYPQAIILSGTSGAGKTHCSMLLLRQLFAVAGGGPETDAFKHLAAAFTVLRSLGSAKTTTNSESSRIGQFIEVQVTDGALYRTKIHCYFLDQTRVVRPLPNEKNYHIFYQMLAGLSREERIKLNLEGYTPTNLRYLQNGDTQQDEVEDSTRFQAWKTCLGILGIPFLDVVRVLAAVLLLGNVQFVDGQGLEVDVKGEAELNSVAGLLGVPPAALFRGLTTRTHNARGQLVKSVCDANMSNMTRDCLAKALYCRTVATIVRRANSLKRLGSTLGTLSSDSNESVHNQGDVASQHASTIGGNSGSKSMAALNNAVRHATDGFIGILDMFGFEEQSPAQLEHLCINLCAETMQHFYNTHIFKSSVESCRDEGILCDTEVDYVDNVPCIDLISSLRTGLLSMLDAECSVRGTAESYVAKIKVQHRNSTRLETKHTELHDPRMFTIRHFAGKVEYDATEFLDTNRDVVPDDLVAVFYKHTCNFGFATHLFGSELKALYAMENVPRGLSFRIAPTSHTDLLNGDEPVSTLTQDFHTRLDNLLRTLVHARPHFVRCIRSNSNEIPGQFERITVVKQIRALQVLETVNLMASGFPHRMRFKQFTARYKMLAPFRLLRRCEEKALEDCDLILQYAMENLPEIDGSVTLSWAPGKRHVFLSEGIRQHLEKLRSDVRTKSATLIQAIWRGWQLRKRIGTVRRPREIILTSTKLNKSTPNAAPRISSTTGTTTRPRPQPIAGTPPPDPNEKCDSKIIQQTCTLFGLDLERPPPVPPSRPYTVTGNSKLGYPQTRIMKMNFPEDSITNPPVEQLKKGETVTVVGASHCRGHLIVEHKGQSFHVPFQYMSSPWKISTKCMEN
ncbi:unconventional myosin-Ia isoform X2 [Condylostylus longicornis]|uniref:unconventional myosin-Ia isoform X2 n=1 Tax=Condylostylus longicornis TaxID=2530218 RepID=UPI00244DAD29|nr:unconventional myosin-Ia isoform X2 [Condylostylus longicornis]